MEVVVSIAEQRRVGGGGGRQMVSEFSWFDFQGWGVGKTV